MTAKIEDRLRWSIIGIAVDRCNPDNRYHSYSDFNHGFRIEADTEEEVLAEAAKHDAQADDAASGAYGTGRTFYWFGPYLMVETDQYGCDPDSPEDYYIDSVRDDDDHVGRRVEAVPEYAEARAAKEKAKKAKDASDAKARERARVSFEKAQYERLREKYGDNQKSPT